MDNKSDIDDDKIYIDGLLLSFFNIGSYYTYRAEGPTWPASTLRKRETY